MAALLTSGPEAMETGNGFDNLAPREDLVSVIVPSYSHEEFVEEALRSVGGQSHGSIEIILIDDQSPDRTYEVALAVLRAGKLPYCAIRRRHAGMDTNINAGILLAHGNWIAILASDDAFPANAFADLLRAARRNAADVVVGSVQEIARDGQFKASRAEAVARYRSLSGNALRKALLEEHGSLMIQGMLISRRVFASVGMFAQELVASDFDFLIRMASLNVRFSFVDQVTAFHRTVRDTLSREHIQRSLRSHLGIARRHAQSRREYRLSCATFLCEAAATSLHYRYYADAVLALGRGLGLAPLRTVGYVLRRLIGRLNR